MNRRVRWAILLAPLLLPWVVVSWGTGQYVLFALGWIDPGPRIVTVLALFGGRRSGLAVSGFALAHLLALGLYVGALGWLLVRRQRGPGSPVASGMLFLAGLNVAFYGLGTARQAGLVAIPLGVAWLFLAATAEYRAYLSGE
ncbi:MAG: hypothetical protein ABEJ77_02250 [Halanaeroarchaeum sp.]